MDISIEIESNKVMKADYIDPWTVTLRNDDQSSEYNKQRDYSYRSSIFCLTILWIIVLLSQLLQIPVHLQAMAEDPGLKFGMTMTISTTVIFISFLLVQLFIIIAQYGKTLPESVREISLKFSNCQSMRKFVISFTVLMMVLCCSISSLDIVRIPEPIINNSSSSFIDLEDRSSYKSQSIQYLIHVWTVSIISLSTFIKLHYLYKTVMLTITFTLYSTLIILFTSFFPDNYTYLYLRNC